MSDHGFWRSPVPYFESKREIWLAIFALVLFEFFFLLFFQPFGVNNYDPSESIDSELILGLTLFSLAMFAALAFSEFVLRPLIIPVLTGRSGILWLFWNLIFLSTVLFLTYNVLGGWHDWTIASYGEFIVNTSVLACFPVAAIIFFLYQRDLRRRVPELSVEHHEMAPDKVVLTADNGNRITLDPESILYLQSQDNYVMIHVLSEKGHERHLLRGTIKGIATQVAGTSLVQCHRAFIVNTGRVESYQGNLHKMHLTLAGSSMKIPVSPSFTREMQ